VIEIVLNPAVFQLLACVVDTPIRVPAELNTPTKQLDNDVAPVPAVVTRKITFAIVKNAGINKRRYTATPADGVICAPPIAHCGEAHAP